MKLNARMIVILLNLVLCGDCFAKLNILQVVVTNNSSTNAQVISSIIKHGVFWDINGGKRGKGKKLSELEPGYTILKHGTNNLTYYIRKKTGTASAYVFICFSSRNNKNEGCDQQWYIHTDIDYGRNNKRNRVPGVWTKFVSSTDQQQEENCEYDSARTIIQPPDAHGITAKVFINCIDSENRSN